jgi:hypothetical protein
MQHAKALSTEESFPLLCPLISTRAPPADNDDKQNCRTEFHQSEGDDFPKANHRRPASNVHKGRTV